MKVYYFRVAGEIPAHKNERSIGFRADGSVYNGIRQDTLTRMREIKHSLALQLPPHFELLSIPLGLAARIGTHRHGVKDADNATTTLQECLQGVLVPPPNKKGDRWIKFQSGFLIEGQSYPFTELWVWELDKDDKNPWSTAGKVVTENGRNRAPEGARRHSASIGGLSEWVGEIGQMVDDGGIRLGAPDHEDRREHGVDPAHGDVGDCAAISEGVGVPEDHRRTE